MFFDAFLCNQETCPDVYDTIYSLFMDMNKVYFTNSTFWETEVYSKIYQVFIEIARHAENAVKTETYNSSQSMSRITAPISGY